MSGPLVLASRPALPCCDPVQATESARRRRLESKPNVWSWTRPMHQTPPLSALSHRPRACLVSCKSVLHRRATSHPPSDESHDASSSSTECSVPAACRCRQHDINKGSFPTAMSCRHWAGRLPPRPLRPNAVSMVVPRSNAAAVPRSQDCPRTSSRPRREPPHSINS